MPSREDIARRFAELDAAFNAIGFSSHYAIDKSAWRRWTTSTASLIRGACGPESVYYSTFRDLSAETVSGYMPQLKQLYGVFQAARDAYDNDLLFDLEIETAADIFGSFAAAAKQALKENKKDVAAVIASAALEDALKRYAVRNGLDVDDKTLAPVINALKSKGLVSGAQKSLLAGMLKMRNSAMHADWSEITEPEVASLIGFVEQFLLTNFSTGPGHSAHG